MAFAGPAFASRGCPEHHPAPAVRLKDVVYRTDTQLELSLVATPNVWPGRGAPLGASPEGRGHLGPRYGQRAGQPTGRPSRCQIRRARGGRRRRVTDRRDSGPPADVAPTLGGGRYPALVRWPPRSGPWLARALRSLQEGAPNIIPRRGPSERRGLPDGHCPTAKRPSRVRDSDSTT